MRSTQEGRARAAHMLTPSSASLTCRFDKQAAVYSNYQKVLLNNAGSAEESVSGFSSAGLPQHLRWGGASVLRAPLSTISELEHHYGASTTRRKVLAAVRDANTGRPRVASQTKQNKTKQAGTSFTATQNFVLIREHAKCVEITF